MKAFKSLQHEPMFDDFDPAVLGAEPVVRVEEKLGEIVINYNFPGFFVSDDSRLVGKEWLDFTQVNMDATGFLAESGRPLLPSFGRYVQIPDKYDYKLHVEKGAPVIFENIFILPAQEQVTDNPNEKPAFEFDRRFYGKDQLYPEDLVRVSSPMMIDDYVALLIHVTPFQYNAAKKQLLGYGNIRITLELVPLGEVDALPLPLPNPEISLEAFGNLMLNPSRETLYRMLEHPVVTHVPFFLVGPQFIIIHAAEFQTEAKRLAEWKEMRGITTRIFSVADIGNSVTQIKSFIRNWRSEHVGLRYVLLFGDVDMIASETVTGSPFGDNKTDYYYSTATDPVSNTDLIMPWLSIGRIPVRTLAEANEVVDQIIDYEGHPPNDVNYYKRMLFAAYFQDDDLNGQAERAYVRTMEYIRDKMVPMGFTIDRAYVKTTGAPTPTTYLDGTPVPAAVAAAFVSDTVATNKIVNALTNGQLQVGHRDHGMPEGWHKPPFTNTEVDLVTGDAPTIVFSVNCQTGRFDLVAPTESFAEKLLRRDGAAPSLIAATRNSQTWLNDSLMKAIFDAMWGGVLPTFPGGSASYPVRYNRLGDILNYAKAYLPIASTGSDWYIKDHFEIYHVIGDPTLELWRQSPHRAIINSHVEGRYLHIKMTRIPSDTVLSIYAGNTLLRRLHPASDYVRVALPTWVLERETLHTPRMPLKVCFYAPGYRFRQIRPEIWRPVEPGFPVRQTEIKKVRKEPRELVEFR